jgi:microcystin-dependent protein
MSLIGEVRVFVGPALPGGWRACDGGVLDIAAHQPLFSLVGWRYGGDGWTTFQLPTFAAPDAPGRPAARMGIAISGTYPINNPTMLESQEVGEIRLFAGVQPPPGWIPCDGRMLPIAQPFLELYQTIGTTWGASEDGEHFAVPNLRSHGSTPPGDVAQLSYIVAVRPLSLHHRDEIATQ